MDCSIETTANCVIEKAGSLQNGGICFVEGAPDISELNLGTPDQYASLTEKTCTLSLDRQTDLTSSDSSSGGEKDMNNGVNSNIHSTGSSSSPPEDHASNETGDGPWLRELSQGEAIQEMGQSKHQHLITCYRLALCSARPLRVGDVQEALTWLYRKVPQFRLSIVPRGEQLWYRWLASPKLDFEVLDAATDVDDEVERMVTTSFNSAVGPLWRVRLIPMPEGSDHLMPDLVGEFPHQYTILFTFHHAICDGFTNFKICNLFLELINAIIEGDPISEEQLGEFDNGSQTMDLIQKRQTQLHNDRRRMSMIQHDIAKVANYRPLILDALKDPNGDYTYNTSRHITRKLNKDETRRLLQFFKSEELSFHCGFLALANLSLVEMFKKRGFDNDIYEICCFNGVNLRRYWYGDTDKALGCHYGPISLIQDTPSNAKEFFLEYAHDVQTNFYDYLINKRTFDECLFLDVTSVTEAKNLDEFFSNPPEPAQFHYSITNMGDVSNLLSGEGRHVQITWLTRNNSCHKYNSTFVHFFQTFRGQFLYGLEYTTKNITKEVADEYAETIFKFIHDIVQQQT